MQEQSQLHENKDVRIVDYRPQYRSAFRTLNEEWISVYFEMEESDFRALDNPEEYILNKGGKIFVALYKDEPVGVCALIRMDDPEYDFEMAKMVVSPEAQGKHIGLMLGRAVIDAAREAGASNIYLETNTVLKPATNLYYKLGFKAIQGRPSPYKRTNLQMVLDLS